MNILVIGPIPPPIHGCSLANKVLLEQFEKEKIDFTVINTETQNISSSKVGTFSLRKMWNFIGAYKDLFLIKKASVVYTTPGQTFLGVMKYAPFYLMCRIMKKPYIVHVHGNHLGTEYKTLRGVKKYIFHYFISNAKVGIVLSASLKENFNGLLSNDSVEIVENFAEDSLLNLPIIKSTSKLRLLYLSNLMVEKGIIDFLDTLILLKNDCIPFEAHIAGKIEDGLKDIIDIKLNALSEEVVYHGVVFGLEKQKLLAEANVFVLPTFYKMEGQPISLIEAMATGNIIVSTLHSGIPDIVGDRNGFLIEPRNPQLLADTLKHISYSIPDFIEKIGNTNREYVKSRFTERVFSQKIIRIIDEITGT